MKRLIKKLIKIGKNTPKPLINISVSRSAILNNINQFKKLKPGCDIAPVLKSNAYGHGLSLIANEIKNEKIPFFIIDSYFEACALRNENIYNPLLIIGYSSTDAILNNYLKEIIFTISSIDALKELSKDIKRKTNIHIKIDTGMNRQGISTIEKDEATMIIKNNKNIILQGICSHFSDADGIDQNHTKMQIRNWNEQVEYFRKQFPNLKYWHISATAGHIFNDVESNITRLGIGLYGLTNISNLQLKPALEMKTIITNIKKIKTGDKVGYNNTFNAKEEMTIATIPAGYNEGIDRRLSNNGFVKISNTFCPIIGRVSMNITTIDISKIKYPKIGDEVIVLSANKKDKNSIENIAKECNTIPYEIAVHIPQYLRRDIVL